ncbi:MAG: hypothetical protein SNJ59_05580 [Aggregatilineales bacterium]
MSQPVHFVNARRGDWHRAATADVPPFELTADRIICAAPHPRTQRIDLHGLFVFPALVNAHDHLELNHFPRTRFRDRYDNAHDWGEDIHCRLNEEPFRSLRSQPLEDRLFIGLLKNLLCGALTVAQHNPRTRTLPSMNPPVRLVEPFGWAHSLHFETEAQIARSYQATPPHVPWFIHLAEGTDERAAAEYAQLKALGCVGQNTVLIHGVGLRDDDIVDAAPRIRGLVWCPTTNLYLLGQTANVARWHACGGRVALGSDSRLTADGDLLDELVTARRLQPNLQLDSASVCGLDLNVLAPGQPADFVAASELPSRRSDLALIVGAGVPLIGAPEIMAQFTGIKTVPAMLDGVPKAINLRLARRIANCKLAEPGLEVEKLSRRLWAVGL